MEITGVVEKISDQQSPAGAPRKWTKKSFLVNGEWFGGFVTAENKAQLNAVGEGYVVKVIYDVKGNYKNLVSIEVLEGGAASRMTGAPGDDRPQGYIDRAENKDYRITFLASRRDAIEFVKTGVEMGFLSLGNKKADMVDIFYAYVNEYAQKFAEDAYVGREARGDDRVTTEARKAVGDVE